MHALKNSAERGNVPRIINPKRERRYMRVTHAGIENNAERGNVPQNARIQIAQVHRIVRTTQNPGANLETANMWVAATRSIPKGRDDLSNLTGKVCRTTRARTTKTKAVRLIQAHGSYAFPEPVICLTRGLMVSVERVGILRSSHQSNFD